HGDHRRAAPPRLPTGRVRDGPASSRRGFGRAERESRAAADRGRTRARRRDLPSSRPGRVAAHGNHRHGLGRVGRGGSAPAGSHLDAVQARLEELLGHPETCPHGNPIDAATARRRPAGVPLSTLASGATATIYRITEEAEEDAALLSYLEARGLRPGAEITI